MLLEEKKEVTIEKETILYIQEDEAKNELRLHTSDFRTVAFAIKSKIFNPLCVEHQHRLLESGFNIQYSAMKDTSNNASIMLSKKTGIDKKIIGLGFFALIFYKKHKGYIYLLTDVKAKVLKLQDYKSMKLDFYKKERKTH